MQLRDYQEKLLADAENAPNPVCVMPTGAGKMLTSLVLAQRAISSGKSVLWVAHREELCRQALDTAARIGVRAGAIGSTLASYVDGWAPLQIAMVPTLARRKILPRADLLIIDECHHGTASTYVKLVKSYPNRVGFTATPMRGDGAPLGDVFDSIVVGPSVAELTERGILVPCEIESPSKLLNSGEIAQNPVKAWRERAPGEQAIIFAANLNAARQYMTELGSEGALIHGEMHEDLRATELSYFKSGRTRVLVNVGVLTEGFDYPPLAVCILARGVGTAGLWLQIVGRVLRAAPGKTRALVLDLFGSSLIHGPPAEERVYSLTGEAIRVKERDLPKCPICNSLLKAYPCNVCKYSPEGPEVPRVVDEPLVRYAAKRQESPEQKASTLKRWLQQGSIGRAYHKFTAVYGHAPNVEVLRLARK